MIWWAYWETYADSGRPSFLRVGQGRPRWEQSPDILPFATGNFVVVGEDFETEEAAQAAAYRMTRCVDGWTQWADAGRVSCSFS